MVRKNNNTIQAFWVAIGSFSSFALAIVSAAILSRYFDKNEYGTYRQILFVYNTLIVIFTAGLPSVFAYFLPRYNLGQGKDIVWKVSKALFFFGLIFSVFLFTSSGLIADVLKNPELSKGIKIFSPIPMLLLPTLGIEGIFSTYKKSIFIAIYNTLSRILMLLFIVLPVILFKRTYIYAIYGWIIVSVIVLIIAYFFKGIPFKGISLEKSNLSFKDIFKYCTPLLTASIAGMAFYAANQFYISRFFGTKIFAEFSNGFVEIPFVKMITGATGTILMPIFSKAIYEKSNLNQITSLWQNALQKSAILIYPMVIFFLFYSTEVITILFSNTYAESAKYFSTIMILNFFNIILFSPLLLSLGEVRFYARLNYCLAIAIWFLDYLVIITFGTPILVVLCYVIISVCGIGVALWYSSKKLGIPFLKMFPIGRIFTIAFHSLISLSIINLILRFALPHSPKLILLILAFIGYVILLTVSARWFKINYWEILSPLFNRPKESQVE